MDLSNNASRKEFIKEVFDEPPVPPVEFVYGERYLNQGGFVFDTIVGLLDLIFSPDVREMDITAGLGSGKSTFAALFLGYNLYWLNLLKSPQTFFWLRPKSMISVINLGPSKDQAQGVIFNELGGVIEESPWFKGRFRIRARDIYFPGKRVRAISGHSGSVVWKGYNCVAEGTYVMGMVPEKVEDIRKGDEVKTYISESNTFELVRSGGALDTGIQECFQVTAQTGRTIRCTAGHQFLTPFGWLQLKDIDIRTTLVAVSRARKGHRGLGTFHSHITTGEVLWVAIKSIIPCGKMQTYDVKNVVKGHNYIANGFLSHNTFAGVIDEVNFFYDKRGRSNADVMADVLRGSMTTRFAKWYKFATISSLKDENDYTMRRNKVVKKEGVKVTVDFSKYKAPGVPTEGSPAPSVATPEC